MIKQKNKKSEPIILHIDLGNQSVSEWLKENRFIIFSELVRYSEKMLKENLTFIKHKEMVINY